jgi:hypothetical protein
VEILFQTSLSTANACYVQYVPSNNTISVLADSGTAYAGAAQVGLAGTISNSQCTVDAGASSVFLSSNNVTISVALTFKTTFSGTRNIYMNVFNNANALSGWHAEGGWTVVTAPPGNVSVAPVSGSGGTQAFSFVYSDPNGYSDIYYVEVLFQTQPVAQNACYVQYVPASNTISLLSDSGSAYAGSMPLGTAGTVSNSQCIVDAGASSKSSSGNNLTLSVALTFKPLFNGTKNVYMNVFNKASVSSGIQAKASWTVVTAPPVNVSVAPVSGSGASHAFSFVYSDPYGYADIYYAEALFQTQIAGQNACFVQYVRATTTLSLIADSGNAYAGSAQIGVAGTLSNSQCTVDAGASSVSTSGNTLTLTLALTFKPAFTGGKNIYMGVFNNANVFSGWQAEGVWTAP